MKYRDKKWLENQIGLGKDEKAMANECGVTVPTVRKWMKKFNVEKAVPRKELPAEEPLGNVIQVSGPDMRSRLLKLMNLARRDYTVAELRQAAKFPMISAIINTIVREVETHNLVIEDKQAGEGDAKIQLKRVLAMPNKYDRSLRIFFDTFMRDILIAGWANVEVLREKSGQATTKAIAPWKSKLDAITTSLTAIDPEDVEVRLALLEKQNATLKDFLPWLKKAATRPGAIMGFICRDAGRIWMDGLKGFYDVGDVDLFATALSPARKQTLTYWPPEKMARFFFAGTTETDKRLMPLGPTAQAYPIIDILFAVLVLLRERVDTPGWGKLVSFYAGKEAQGVHGDQFNTLVEALREDISSGTLPVVRAPIRAFVDDIGAGLEAEKLMLLIMDEYELIMWQIFGAGLVQMGRMEGQGRQMGKQQMEAAEKQAVGHMLRILRDDFVEGFVINDPWSPYQDLVSRWVDTTAIPTREEMFTGVWLPMMKDAGLPVGAVLEFFPEMLSVLQDKGIDPMELQNPAVLAAMIKAGLFGGTPTEESVQTEKATDVLLKAAEILRAQESRPIHFHMPKTDMPQINIENRMPEQMPPEVKIEHASHAHFEAIKVDAPISVVTPDIKVDAPIHVDPVEVRVDSPIHITTPENKFEPTINVESPKFEPVVNVHPPDVKIEHTTHVAAPEVRVEPQINVAAPEIKFDPTLELDLSKAKVVPDVKVDVHLDDIHLEAELHSPDETIETETMIERDKDGLIKKTMKTSRKKPVK